MVDDVLYILYKQLEALQKESVKTEDIKEKIQITEIMDKVSNTILDNLYE